MAGSHPDPLRLAVLSPKGGCGRSTVAINLAYLLAAGGRRVALVDLAQFGSLGVLLQAPGTTSAGLGPVAACLASVHRDELAGVLQASLTPCQLAHARVSLLAAGAPERHDDLTVEGVVRVLHTLSGLGYDLVLDTSHDLSDRLAGALHACTHRFWVLSPDPAAGWHLLQVLAAAEQLAAPAVPSGLIVNRYHRRSGLRLADLETAVGLPVWGVLPDVPRVLPLAAHLGVPLVAHRRGPWRHGLLQALHRAGVISTASVRPAWRWGKGQAHVQV